MNWKVCIALLSWLCAGTALAESPAVLMNGYASEAARSAPGFVPSGQRGKDFFARKWGVSGKMPNCQSCHGSDLTQEGKHVITGRRIAPLSPLTNGERLTSSAKVEKWFGRNCQEVVGRACTAAEKADLIKFFSNPGVKS